MRNGIRERKRRIGGTQRGNEPRSLNRQGLFTSHSPPTTRHYLSTRPAFSPATHSRPSIFSAAYCVRSFEFQSLASAPLIAATDRKQREVNISNRLKTGGATYLGAPISRLARRGTPQRKAKIAIQENGVPGDCEEPALRRQRRKAGPSPPSPLCGAGFGMTTEEQQERTLVVAGYGVRIGTAYGPSFMKATLGTEPLQRGWFTAQMSAFWTMAAVLSASSR